ncbi:MAG: flagellar biosynthesis protein FlhF [Comamonas sp. SCN 67-35]|uniref:flagellar biosynthesis protein FlhF n=1 Tax=unclassified Comamonas TaxID=2638500 RepID=UPI000868EA1A|nr:MULTISPECIES: flagellar biosynthesis protein FlhF [unclassified Comamonas]MBN9329846.1 flagellar biosynthesis protein FlhF [Comamonas sp.]ODU40142.1 MAG: flagellar biosynthesis protein FlhF [Comamonas sp. SCN 67-35]OJW97154.1 MAG: flagellar biosynthesis protein FlhF [Burkholderiales bacterium 66-26]
MNIQRFHAPTAREALAKARMTFGDGTLILSNRPVDGGVEVVATAEDSLPPAQSAPRLQPLVEPRRGRLQERADDLAASPVRSEQVHAGLARSSVAKDTEKLAMSTLSFQDYVRERMLRRRQEALHGSAAPAPSEPAARVSAPARRSAPVDAGADRVPAPARRSAPAAAAPTPAAAVGQQHLMQELQAMKDLIEDRFNTLAWLGQARQNPVQSSLMLKLIRAGYSPALARAVLEHLAENLPAPNALQWLMEVLQRNLKTDALSLPLHEEGGIYALVGATGVGKTTTAAKLAAMCARVHGPGSVGLITLDTYRVGAHEQLRAYGRMLGVVAHLAHDRAALQDLLGLLSSKKMVLIDTTGVAPRDPRREEMLQVLDLPDIKRLLVLNACNHGDTFDDVLTGFKITGVQQAVLSKTDEAVKLGPSIDALIRHQVLLRGVTSGQRVPEDWEAADARKLVAASMRSAVKSAFDPKEIELNYFFTQAPVAATVGEAELADVA